MRIITEHVDENFLELVLTERELARLGYGSIVAAETMIEGVPYNVSVVVSNSNYLLEE